MTTEKVELSEGKYTVCLDEDYTFYALRHGEPWRDMCGDGMIFSMFREIQELRKQVEYQTSRADANWKALCECRGEEV